MRPVDPQIEGMPTVFVGAGRTDVEALPAVNIGDAYYTVWEPTPVERRAMVDGARLTVWITHYGRPISPLSIGVEGVDPDGCEQCGCTEENACEGGCGWARPGLCSRCAGVER